MYTAGMARRTACSGKHNVTPLLLILAFLSSPKGLTGSSDVGQLRTDFILTRNAQGGER